MTALMKLGQGLRRAASGVVQGVFDITHSGIALIGLAVIFTTITLGYRSDLREITETRLLGWLQSRQSEATGMDSEIDAIDRTTATDPQDLPKQQSALAFWLSKKYRVAPEPIGALVAAAYDTGLRVKLDPTLILAVMAVESGFNPFAQSSMGAQGLMQVVTKVHRDKYEYFGGNLAAFDPLSNLRVGAKVLQECIQRAGSIPGGLRLYVGAGNTSDDGGYAEKVLAEHARLQGVSKASGNTRSTLPAGGKRVTAQTQVAVLTRLD